MRVCAIADALRCFGDAPVGGGRLSEACKGTRRLGDRPRGQNAPSGRAGRPHGPGTGRWAPGRSLRRRGSGAGLTAWRLRLRLRAAGDRRRLRFGQAHLASAHLGFQRGQEFGRLALAGAVALAQPDGVGSERRQVSVAHIGNAFGQGHVVSCFIDVASGRMTGVRLNPSPRAYGGRPGEHDPGRTGSSRP